MSDVKVSKEYTAAAQGQNVVTKTLKEVRDGGWKNACAAVKGGAVLLISDATSQGSAIRAIVTANKDPVTKKVVCIGTCQTCSIGFEVAAQDVWQTTECLPHRKTKPRDRVGGKKSSGPKTTTRQRELLKARAELKKAGVETKSIDDELEATGYVLPDEVVAESDDDRAAANETKEEAAAQVELAPTDDEDLEGFFKKV
jgi:hypothetical protein